MKYQTYWLLDSANNPFYVGQTKKPMKLRLEQHLSVAKNNPVYPVHQHIVTNNYTVKIESIEEFTKRRFAIISEHFWIHQLKAWGFTIKNIRPFEFSRKAK